MGCGQGVEDVFEYRMISPLVCFIRSFGEVNRVALDGNVLGKDELAESAQYGEE